MKELPHEFTVLYKDSDGAQKEAKVWAFDSKDAIQNWEEEEKLPNQIFVRVK